MGVVKAGERKDVGGAVLGVNRTLVLSIYMKYAGCETQAMAIDQFPLSRHH
jgi:hypothetical protein